MRRGAGSGKLVRPAAQCEHSRGSVDAVRSRQRGAQGGDLIENPAATICHRQILLDEPPVFDRKA